MKRAMNDFVKKMTRLPCPDEEYDRARRIHLKMGFVAGVMAVRDALLDHGVSALRDVNRIQDEAIHDPDLTGTVAQLPKLKM